MRVLLIALLAAGVTTAGCKKKKAGAEGEGGAKAPAAATAAKPKAGAGSGAAAPGLRSSYPATAEGLRDFAADLVRVQLRDPAEARRLGDAVLSLPNPEAWFARVFGPDKGKNLAAEYAIYGRYGAEMPELIAQQGTKLGRKHFEAEKLEDAKDPAATGLQARALAAMVAPTPLYALRMTGEGKRDFVLYNFIHDGATFHYVGRLMQIDGKRPSKDELAKLEKRQREVAAPASH